jgi:hypothetical protein
MTPISKTKIQTKGQGEGAPQIVECLPKEVLGSIPSTAKRKKKKRCEM